MSAGILTFERFNGTEQFSIRRAELFLLGEDHTPRQSLDFEADGSPNQRRRKTFRRYIHQSMIHSKTKTLDPRRSG